MAKSSSQRPPEGGKPSRKSWRGSGTVRPTSVSADSSSWMVDRGTQRAQTRRWMRGVPLAIVAVILLVALGIIIIRRPRPVPLVWLYVTGYEAPFTPQAFALEDIERLHAQFPFPRGTNARNIRVDQPLEQGKPPAAFRGDAAAFLTELEERVGSQAPGGPNKDVVLVYLSAQGLVNAEGQPCLMIGSPDSAENLIGPPEALPPDRLVPVEKLIETLSRTQSGARRHKSKIVLLLDAVRWDRNWRLGIAANDFVTQLGALLERIGANLNSEVVVLSSCSDGERGLVDLKRGATLFGDRKSVV